MSLSGTHASNNPNCFDRAVKNIMNVRLLNPSEVSTQVSTLSPLLKQARDFVRGERVAVKA